MPNALNTSTSQNVCAIVNDHASLINNALTTFSYTSNGNITATRSDGTTFGINTPLFSDFVISGLNFTFSSIPNASTLNYTAGTYQLDGQLFTIGSGGSIVVNAGDLNNPRIDVVYATNTGNIVYLAGTPSASPVTPSVPSDSLVLCEIGVEQNATATTGGYTLVQINIISQIVQRGTSLGQVLFWDTSLGRYRISNAILINTNSITYGVNTFEIDRHVTVSSNTSVSMIGTNIQADTTGGNVTLTLPGGTIVDGVSYKITKISDPNLLTINLNGKTIENSSTNPVLTKKYSYLHIIYSSVGDTWVILNK